MSKHVWPMRITTTELPEDSFIPNVALNSLTHRNKEGPPLHLLNAINSEMNAMSIEASGDIELGIQVKLKINEDNLKTARLHFLHVIIEEWGGADSDTAPSLTTRSKRVFEKEIQHDLKSSNHYTSGFIPIDFNPAELANRQAKFEVTVSGVVIIELNDDPDPDNSTKHILYFAKDPTLTITTGPPPVDVQK